MSDTLPDPYTATGARSSPELRREAVRRRVAEAGFVRVDVLASEFAVSIMTVHRDLDELEERGFLHKVRGGATTAPTTTFHGDLPHRMQAQVGLCQGSWTAPRGCRGQAAARAWCSARASAGVR